MIQKCDSFFALLQVMLEMSLSTYQAAASEREENVDNDEEKEVEAVNLCSCNNEKYQKPKIKKRKIRKQNCLC